VEAWANRESRSIVSRPLHIYRCKVIMIAHRVMSVTNTTEKNG